MKRNAIIRIILFSIAIVLLLGILGGIWAFDRLSYFQNSNSLNGSVIVEDGINGDYSSSGQTAADGIKDLEIDWAAGSITILPGDNKTIHFQESGASAEKDLMVWKIDGDKLVIQYSKEGGIDWDGINFGVHLGVTESKDLMITVPRDWICRELEINSASSNVIAQDLSVHEIDINTASGICKLQNCTVDDLNMETMSGDITFTGILDTLDCDAVSANCSITVSNKPTRIDMDGVSGNLDLYLPEDCGFTAVIDSVSGEFYSEFEASTQSNRYVYGDGACRIEMDAVSGDIHIQKG